MINPSSFNSSKHHSNMMSMRDATNQDRPRLLMPKQTQSLAMCIAKIMHMNMMSSCVDNSTRRVKKDVLWKPLLRGFRSFYRDELS